MTLLILINSAYLIHSMMTSVRICSTRGCNEDPIAMNDEKGHRDSIVDNVLGSRLTNSSCRKLHLQLKTVKVNRMDKKEEVMEL